MLSDAQELPQNNPLLAVGLKDAQILLAYSAKAGIALDEALVQCIVDTGVAAKTRVINSDEEAKFWSARNKLAHSLSPVTIESVDAMSSLLPSKWYLDSSTRARQAEYFYRMYAIVMLIVLLFVQVYWLEKSRVLKPKLQRNRSRCS
jgi:hypothetical protein